MFWSVLVPVKPVYDNLVFFLQMIERLLADLFLMCWSNYQWKLCVYVATWWSRIESRSWFVSTNNHLSFSYRLYWMYGCFYTMLFDSVCTGTFRISKLYDVALFSGKFAARLRYSIELHVEWMKWKSSVVENNNTVDRFLCRSKSVMLFVFLDKFSI